MKLRVLPVRLLLETGACLSSAGLFTIGLYQSTNGALCGVVLLTLGEILFAPSALYFVALVSPPESRGQYLALFGLAHGAALVGAPLLGGEFYPWFGPVWFWLAIGGACLLAVPLFLCLPENPKPPVRPRGRH